MSQVRIPGQPGRGHLAMFVFSALVAGSFSLGALAANLVPPMALNAVRFVMAAAILGVVAHATGQLPKAAFAAPWRYLVLGSLFSFYFVLMFEALKTAAPVSTAAVFTLTPLMAAGFGYLILGQRMTRRMALALAIGATGALWVIFRADLSALLAFRIGHGERIFLIGAVAHAAYIPMVARLNRGEGPAAFTFGTLLAGALVLVALGWRGIAATDWLHLPALVWGVLLYLAIASTAISFALLQFAALRLPAAKVMAYTYLVPSWVIVWEAGLGKPPPQPAVLAGVALTIFALGLLLKAE